MFLGQARRRGVSSSFRQVNRAGWAVLGTAAVFRLFAMPLQVYGGLVVPILHRPVAEGGEFGWSGDLISVALAGFFLVGGLLAPICASLSDRWSGRMVLLAMAALYSLSMMLLGLVHSEWHFLLVYSVGLSIVFTMSLGPLFSLIAPWFRRQLGVGVGILWLAGGVGAVAFPPALAYLIETVGWTPSFFAFGLAGGSLMFALALRYRPDPQTRRRPIVDGETVWAEHQLVRAREWLIRRQIRNTHAYWKLPIIHGLGCGGHGIILAYLIGILVHDGFSSVEATLALSVSQAFSIPSRLFGPLIAERTDGRIVMSAVLALQGLSAAALLLTHDLLALCLVSAVFGLAYGSESSVYPVVNRKYFGDRPMSSLFGRQTLGSLIGQSLSVVTAGMLINHLGNWAGFGLAIALNFVGCGLVWTMESTRQVLVSEDAKAPGYGAG